MINQNQIDFKSCNKVICFLLILLTTTLFYGQGEASNWYFGRNAGINFNNGDVKSLTDGAIQTNEGCASISNKKGELLFYTDGIIVWDRNHNVMPNGSDLLGNKSSTQSAVIVPKPNSDAIYYIFTVIQLGGIEGVRYSEVDMALNNGNGDITSNKNVLLITPSAEKISAIGHANGKDYWVASHGWNSNEFSVFKVTENGVETTPVISSVGSYHGNVTLNSIGYMKFSPNGSRLALAKWSTNSAVEIFDFDSSTGIISNPIIIDNYFDNDYRDGTYGIEFSPNSNVLYVSEIDLTNYVSELHQFNLTTYSKTAIINSDRIIYSGRNLIAAIQLGFDGKIYVCNPFSSYLSVIQNPNTIGVNCNYVEREISLSGKSGVFGLPSFIQSLFVAECKIENICLGGSTQFSIKTDEPIDEIFWDFGDAITSNEVLPTHNYLAIGNYTVTAQIKSGNSIFNVTKEVVIYELPTAYKATDYIICEDSEKDGFESFDLRSKDIEVLNGQSDIDFQVSYFESYEDAEVNKNELNSVIINKENYQEIYARVSNRLNSECYDISSFRLIIETAIAGEVENLIICITDNPSKESVAVDLSQFNEDIYSSNTVTPHADYFITYHLTQLDADEAKEVLIPENFEAKSNSSTNIFARLENDETGCFTTTNFEIIINEVIAYKPIDMYLCDDTLADGKAFFDLESQASQILNGQDAKVTYHITQVDADTGSNPISENFKNEFNPQQLFVRVENLNDALCFDTTTFNIQVDALPVIDILDTWYLCPGEDLELYLNSIHDKYSWSTGETSSEIVVNVPGAYDITVYNTDNISCSTSKTIKVIESNSIENVEVNINDLNSRSNSITVQVEENGNYEYSIDAGYTYQYNNHFENLISGDYMVFVRDENGCVVYSEEVYVLSYPKFFTPNNDGYNDFWKIEFSEKEPDIKVDIFDRYGKKIAQIEGISKGWDGLFNGQVLAVSDYWFVINRPSRNKQYRGHFTLKR